MKKNLHPKWYSNAKVICGCGNTFTTGSTVPEIRIEICNKCHPFYTGEQKLIDTEGRVEKFQRKTAKAKELKKKYMEKIKSKKTKTEKEIKRPITLKDMLKKTMAQ